MHPFIVLAVCVLLTPVPAYGGETEVLIDARIDGRLTVPNDPPRSAVLLLHGFSSHMDEVGDLYAELAARLADQGIASLRINFTGEGPQADYVVTTTFAARTAEAKAAFAYLQRQVPAVRYGVVGFSLGGLTAMALVGDEPEAFDAVVLWSAAQTLDLTSSEPYASAARQALLTGRGTVTTFAEIILTRKFLTSFMGIDVSPNLARYRGSLLSIRGTEDHLPAHDPRWLGITPSTDKAFLLIGGADHIFNVLDDPRPAHGETVIAATVRWFDRLDDVQAR